MREENLECLHARYLVQATWTDSVRQLFFDQIEIQVGQKVLEVGSGTGVISAEIARRFPVECTGVDIDFDASAFAQRKNPEGSYLAGDGLELPFEADVFHVALCHFLLLWVEDPGQILREMARVTKPGQWILAFAEPDYGGRLDFPHELETIGQAQIQALQEQGADPYLGRTLRSLYQKAGLTDIRAGVLGGEWHGRMDDDQIQSEWETMIHDLSPSLSTRELKHYQSIDSQARKMGTRVLFVPTFYAAGRVPHP